MYKFKDKSALDFDDLIGLLKSLGFESRVKESYHLFRKEGVREKVNLQRAGNKAKR